MKTLLFFAMCLLLSIISCTSTTDGVNEPKADLIIDNIEYEKSDYDSLDNNWLYKFKIIIGNIGNEAVNNSLFLLSTSSQEDYVLERFTSGTLVNYDSIYIQPDFVILDSTMNRIDADLDLILFKIAAKGDTTKNGYVLPYAEESDYENNFYILNIVD